MDLSDGLADAVRQVASASNVGITLDAGAIPVSDAVRQWHARHGGDVVDTAFTAGDDYELLFTVRPVQRGRLRGILQTLGVPVTRIGVVTKQTELAVRGATGMRALPSGYEHFRTG